VQLTGRRIVAVHRRVPTREPDEHRAPNRIEIEEACDMVTHAGAPPVNGRADEPDLRPLGVVEAPEAGGWVVVNLDSLRVVEPGYVWPRREHAVRWARQELERERREEMEYRLRQDAPIARALEARGAAPRER
jgi:hypothetical protein